MKQMLFDHASKLLQIVTDFEIYLDQIAVPTPTFDFTNELKAEIADLFQTALYYTNVICDTNLYLLEVVFTDNRKRELHLNNSALALQLLTYYHERVDVSRVGMVRL